MAETIKPTVNEEYINKMYDSQLGSQKEQLSQSYNQALSDIDTVKQQGQQQLSKNLNATAVEAQRAQKNYNEVQNAYGLTSGAMAQARLAQDNQLQADLTALRAAQQTADAIHIRLSDNGIGRFSPNSTHLPLPRRKQKTTWPERRRFTKKLRMPMRSCLPSRKPPHS